MKNIWLYGLLLMLPLYGFWVLPQKNQNEATLQSVETLQTQTADYRLKIEQLQDLNQRLEDPRYQGVLERIPPTFEQETLILLLNRIADSTGFVFEGLSFSRGQNAEVQTPVINVNFAIKGRRESFSKFLQAIEKSPRFLGISSFGYSMETVNNVDIINMSVPLYAFSQSNQN